jgi:hypothetical protein
LRRDGALAGRGAIGAGSVMSEASISVDVLVSHAFYGEAFPRGGTTSFRIDLMDALNSVRHFFFDGIDEETGAAVMRAPTGVHRGGKAAYSSPPEKPLAFASSRSRGEPSVVQWDDSKQVFA